MIFRFMQGIRLKRGIGAWGSTWHSTAQSRELEHYRYYVTTCHTLHLKSDTGQAPYPKRSILKTSQPQSWHESPRLEVIAQQNSQNYQNLSPFISTPKPSILYPCSIDCKHRNSTPQFGVLKILNTKKMQLNLKSSQISPISCSSNQGPSAKASKIGALVIRVAFVVFSRVDGNTTKNKGPSKC